MVMDPLKAMHKVRGVSAREMCHYFFNPRYRYEWESEFLIYSYSVFSNTFTLFTNVTLNIKQLLIQDGRGSAPFMETAYR